jgi:ComF family protein
MSLLDLLFPKTCLGCGTWGSYICATCKKTLPLRIVPYQICPVCCCPAVDGLTHPRCRNRYSLDGVTSFFMYKGIIQKAVKEIKYRFVSDMAKALIDIVPVDLLHLIPTSPTTVLLPIPLHPSRFRYRGFNQAEVLANVLSSILHANVSTTILSRTIATTPQVAVKEREARRQNIKGAFIVSSKTLPDQIVLVDDVWTTGATMQEAGKTLKKAGVKTVWGITVARA